MEKLSEVLSVHPAGEGQKAYEGGANSWPLDAPGERFYAEWDTEVYHSYFVANLRISLGVELRPGNEHAAARGMLELWKTLGKLPRSRWPTYASGDCGDGNEAVMLEFEERGFPYLFKLRHTPKVKALVKAMMGQGALWAGLRRWLAGTGKLAPTQRLDSRAGVILVRENPSRAPIAIAGKSPRGKDRQGQLLHAQGEGRDAQVTPWSGKIAVLVTSLDPVAFPAQAMPKQYLDRADAENSFDELKNQWGWGGFTSRKLGSSRLMANLAALFYNWWNLYVRFFDEEHHREAVRSCGQPPDAYAGRGPRCRAGDSGP